MASGMSDYLKNELLDHLHGCQSRNWTPPANIWVALSTADPGADGSGLSEPVGGAYDRVQTGAADWGVAVGGIVSNATDVEFPTPTGDWGLCTHWALMDAASGGNMIWRAPLTTPKTIETGADVSFPAGDLQTKIEDKP